jgi:hypothetical protein
MICRQNLLRCKLVAVQLGEVVVMASQALLGALAALKGSSKKGSRRGALLKGGAKPPSLHLRKLVPDTAALVDLLPDQVPSVPSEAIMQNVCSPCCSASPSTGALSHHHKRE